MLYITLLLYYIMYWYYLLNISISFIFIIIFVCVHYHIILNTCMIMLCNVVLYFAVYSALPRANTDSLCHHYRPQTHNRAIMKTLIYINTIILHTYFLNFFHLFLSSVYFQISLQAIPFTKHRPFLQLLFTYIWTEFKVVINEISFIIV